MTDATVRRLKLSVVGLSWVTGVYLVAHYTAVQFLGPERLFNILGEGLYNALIPIGGLPFLFVLVLGIAVWLVPFSIVFVLVSLVLHAVLKLKRYQRHWAAAVVAGSVTLSLPFVLLDGWPWTLMPLVWEDDTEFSPGYSEVGFWKVEAGMSPADVVARVGAPLERYRIPDSEGVGWRWTRSPHDSSYRVRVVIFLDGRVSEKISVFYVD